MPCRNVSLFPVPSFVSFHFISYEGVFRLHFYRSTPVCCRHLISFPAFRRPAPVLPAQGGRFSKEKAYLPFDKGKIRFLSQIIFFTVFHEFGLPKTGIPTLSTIPQVSNPHGHTHAFRGALAAHRPRLQLHGSYGLHFLSAFIPAFVTVSISTKACEPGRFYYCPFGFSALLV